MTELPAEHPPLANKTVCVDFDGTIIPWGPLMEMRLPFPGVVEAMVLLREAGYRIVILTSRLSPAWCRDEARRRHTSYGTFLDSQYGYIEEVLRVAGIPWDLITDEKVPAEVYFDDKAVRVTKDYPLNYCIDDFLNGDFK